MQGEVAWVWVHSLAVQCDDALDLRIGQASQVGHLHVTLEALRLDHRDDEGSKTGVRTDCL